MIKQLKLIAVTLLKEGYSCSEGVPYHKWTKRGYPESKQIFKVIDSYMKYIVELDKLERELANEK